MIFDITRPLVEGMRVYDGHEQYRVQKTRSVQGDGYNLSHFSMGAHCGSHMDAPAHFLPEGATIDAFPLEWMLGKALLLTARGSGGLRFVPHGTERLIIRSGEDFFGLSDEDARELIQKGVRVIGTDRLSVSLDGCEAQVHKTLLAANIWIVENLDLSAPPDGYYEFICLPLSLKGLEGAPVRALLKEWPA